MKSENTEEPTLNNWKKFELKDKIQMDGKEIFSRMLMDKKLTEIKNFNKLVISLVQHS